MLIVNTDFHLPYGYSYSCWARIMLLNRDTLRKLFIDKDHIPAQK
jgi:hypothetical protein